MTTLAPGVHLTQSGLLSPTRDRLARGLGYQGDFGSGGFSNWLGQNNLQGQWQSLVDQNRRSLMPVQQGMFGDTMDVWRNVYRPQLAREYGYTGDFGTGEWQDFQRQHGLFDSIQGNRSTVLGNTTSPYLTPAAGGIPSPALPGGGQALGVAPRVLGGAPTPPFADNATHSLDINALRQYYSGLSDADLEQQLRGIVPSQRAGYRTMGGL